MANAAIAFQNLADAGTVTASSEVAAMPVTRLQGEHVSQRWRSTADVAWVVCDLLSEQSFDTIALMGMTASESITVVGRVSSDNDEYTKVLLHMDGSDASTTFTDSNAGGSAHTWTAAGNAQIDTAQSKFGGASGLFDGTGDWISTPDHADFALGTGDWTIDGWFRCNAAGGTARTIAVQGDDPAVANDTSFFLRRTGGNVIACRVSDGTSLVEVAGTAQYTDAVNTGWHHVAVVRSGNTLKLFIDGVEAGAATFSGTVQDSTDALFVGSMAAGSNAWLGWIDEFRISVGIARWTADFSPPLTAADGLGGAGDLYFASFDVNDAELKHGYGMFVLALASPLTGRFVRLGFTDTPASYVEAGRLFVGLREAFTYNYVPGAARTWTDRSRKTKTSGGQTLIWPDNKFRSIDLNFEWITEAQADGLIESIDMVNGQSIDVLLILDTASTNLPRDSIFGLITEPGAVIQSQIPDILARQFRIEERL